MKTVFEHIEHIKGKPHHIRKKIAFATAAGVTSVIALVWLTSSLGTGAFAIKGSSFADSAGQSAPETADNNVGRSGLAGAASALLGADAPAHIEVIDAASSTSQKKVEQTVIPF